MNNKCIKSYFNSQYNENDNLKAVLSQIRKEEKMKVNKFMQMAAVFVLIIGITAGVGYAGTVVYQKIFKEPKEFESFEEFNEKNMKDAKEKQGTQEITKEDEEKAVNMDEAIIEANKFLNELGYEKQEFVTKDLKKNYIMGAELVYYFTTDANINKGIHIGVNAENGKVVDFSDENMKYNNAKYEVDQITEEEATNYANKLFEMFRLKENYKLHEIKETPYFFQNESVDVWNAMFYKEYDGATSQFERVELNFFIEKGQLKIFSMYIANENVDFQNNPTEISKEEAEKIALEKDKILTDNEVDYIITKLQVRQPNSWIYAFEQNGGKYPENNKEIQEDGTIISYPKYEGQANIARKVWTVNIHYKKKEPNSEDFNKYNTKSMFVDVTTGEIIGGADESYWE